MLDWLKGILFLLSDTSCPQLNISKFITFLDLDLFFDSFLDLLEGFNNLKPSDWVIWLINLILILVDIPDVVNSRSGGFVVVD